MYIYIYIVFVFCEEPWWNLGMREFVAQGEPEDVGDVDHYINLLDTRIPSFMQMVNSS